MNGPCINEHAGWFRDTRRLLDITEVTPGLPIPSISKDRVTYFYVGITHAEDAAEAVAAARTILGYGLAVTFVPRWTQAGSMRHYILTALLPSGLQVDIVALAEHFDGQDAQREMAQVA